MSIPHINPAFALHAPRRAPRRIETEEDVISPRRLQQIENATVVLATALSSSVVFYAVMQFMA